MDDAGDLVPLADVEKRALVRAIQTLDEDPLVNCVSEQIGARSASPVLREHARLAEVEQGLSGVRADEAEPARHEDHPYVTARACSGSIRKTTRSVRSGYGWPRYLSESRSMITQAASPSTRSATRPRTDAITNG